MVINFLGAAFYVNDFIAASSYKPKADKRQALRTSLTSLSIQAYKRLETIKIPSLSFDTQIISYDKSMISINFGIGH